MRPTDRRVAPRRRTIIGGACLVVVLAVGAGTWVVAMPPARTSADAETGGNDRTAVVTKGDLTDSKVFAGTVGHGTPVELAASAPGTLTWLPGPGQVVHRDEPLYAVDEREVRAMDGTVPLWRPLGRGLRGADVRQLNDNLGALGYDVALDDSFGRRTERAVRRWQADRGRQVTGQLTAADIAFVDGDVRVAAVTGRLGTSAVGDVLSVTGTDRIVVATVSQRDAERLAVGATVRVRVNGTGALMAGTVTDVRPAVGDDVAAKVDVSVSFESGDRQFPTAAPAQVVAVGATEPDVLSVPVSALVTTGSAAYAVDVVHRDGTRERVRVTPGFAADGRIAITGTVAAGDRVVVPG